MKRKLICWGFVLTYLFPMVYAYAVEDWRVEFDYLCGKAEESMAIKAEE